MSLYPSKKLLCNNPLGEKQRTTKEQPPVSSPYSKSPSWDALWRQLVQLNGQLDSQSDRQTYRTNGPKDRRMDVWSNVESCVSVNFECKAGMQSVKKKLQLMLWRQFQDSEGLGAKNIDSVKRINPLHYTQKNQKRMAFCAIHTACTL